jgi:ABC-type dipeptide/oligopeptide/nickel transport system permease component
VKAFFANRLLNGLLTVAVFTILIFTLVRLTGDPVNLMVEEAPTADREQIAERLGLDQPVHIQFVRYITSLVQGDLGTSFRYNAPVTDIFWERFPNTLALLLPSFALATIVGIPLGVIAAIHRGRGLGTATSLGAVLGIAVPHFWLALVMMMIFSAGLGWLPSARMGGPEHYVIPVFVLSTTLMAGIMRLVRSSLLEQLSSEYVQLARTKGLSERQVIWGHALSNSLLPAVAFIGTYAAMIIVGTVVIETVFAWPGTGRLLVDAVVNRDFPLTQGIIILQGVLIVVINFGSDLLYGWLDPRIRTA